MFASGSVIERSFLRDTELALLNAPFDDSGWLNAIDMVARATRSRGANLVCLGGAVPSLNLITGFDQQEVDAVFADPELWGERNWRVATATAPFEIQHDLHYRAHRERFGSGYYCEVADQLDMVHGCQTLFSHDASGFIGLAIMRSRHEGPGDPDMIEKFAYLSRVAARAMRAELALAGEGVRLRLGTIDESSEALILVNRHGWACGMSDLAASYLDRGVPLRFHGARVAASNPGDARRLDQLLTYLLHADDGRCKAPIVMPMADMDGSGWRLHITALSDCRLSLGFDACLAMRVEQLPSATLRNPSVAG